MAIHQWWFEVALSGDFLVVLVISNQAFHHTALRIPSEPVCCHVSSYALMKSCLMCPGCLYVLALASTTFRLYCCLWDRFVAFDYPSYYQYCTVEATRHQCTYRGKSEQTVSLIARIVSTSCPIMVMSYKPILLLILVGLIESCLQDAWRWPKQNSFQVGLEYSFITSLIEWTRSIPDVQYE